MPVDATSSSADAAEPFVRDVLEYESWKESLPVLYDCFLHSNLEWPSYACAWGPVIADANGQANNPSQAEAAAALASSAGASASAAASTAAIPPCLTGAALTPASYSSSYISQLLYLSRSTDSRLEKDKWIGSPNMLLKCELYYPNQYRIQDLSKMSSFTEDARNPAMLVRKKFVHPGEVNRIKIVPPFPDLVATHTDSPLVYVWNTNTQASRRSQVNTEPSVPDLTLQGHEEHEEVGTLYYALDCAAKQPIIISGGSDQKICLWNIEDYCSTLTTTANAGMAPPAPPSSTNSPARASKQQKHIERLLSPRQIFSGHTGHVEEVNFHPHSSDMLCSVADDGLLILWDTRLSGNRPSMRIHTMHTDDVNAVHWNGVNDNLIITGSSDHTVKLIDLRRIAKCDSFMRAYDSSSTRAASLRSHHSTSNQSAAVVHTFYGHKGNVTNVQWHSNGTHFASGSDDGDLCIWSILGVTAMSQAFPPFDAQQSVDVSASPSSSASVWPAPDPASLPPPSFVDGSDGSSPHLLFRHAGHRTAVVNFAWNHYVKDGWTIASLSDDSADTSLVGGGRLHVWRITDLLTKDFREVQQEFKTATTQATNNQTKGQQKQQQKQQQQQQQQQQAASSSSDHVAPPTLPTSTPAPSTSPSPDAASTRMDTSEPQSSASPSPSLSPSPSPSPASSASSSTSPPTNANALQPDTAVPMSTDG